MQSETCPPGQPFCDLHGSQCRPQLINSSWLSNVRSAFTFGTGKQRSSPQSLAYNHSLVVLVEVAEVATVESCVLHYPNGRLFNRTHAISTTLGTKLKSAKHPWITHAQRIIRCPLPHRHLSSKLRLQASLELRVADSSGCESRNRVPVQESMRPAMFERTRPFNLAIVTATLTYHRPTLTPHWIHWASKRLRADLLVVYVGNRLDEESDASLRRAPMTVERREWPAHYRTSDMIQDSDQIIIFSQLLAIQDFVFRYASTVHWAIVLDVDDFIVAPHHHGLVAYMKQHLHQCTDGVAAVAFAWVTAFDRCDHVLGGHLRRHSAGRWENSNVKSLLRPDHVQLVGVHEPEIMDGEKCHLTIDKGAYIAHLKGACGQVCEGCYWNVTSPSRLPWEASSSIT